MGRCENCKKKGATQKTAIRIWDGPQLKTKELAYCSESCKKKIHSFAAGDQRFVPKLKALVFVGLVLFAIFPLLIRLATGNSFILQLVYPLLLALTGLFLMLQPQGILALKYYRRLGLRYFTLYIRLTGLFMLAVAVITYLSR